jgi:hypothetical protein
MVEILCLARPAEGDGRACGEVTGSRGRPRGRVRPRAKSLLHKDLDPSRGHGVGVLVIFEMAGGTLLKCAKMCIWIEYGKNMV